MNENRKEERVIDLLDLLMSLLERWRALLAVGIICALLISMVAGIRAVSNGVQTVDTSANEEALDKEYHSLRSTLLLYLQYNYAENYYINSVLNNDDFTKANLASSTYQIKLTDAGNSVVTLESVYSDLASDSEFVSEVLAYYPLNISDSDFKDVCELEVNAKENPTDTITLFVKALLPESLDSKTWSDGLNKALKKYSKKIAKTVGEQDVKLVSLNVLDVDSDYVSNLQNDKIKDASNARITYMNTLAGLTADDQAIIQKLVYFIKNDGVQMTSTNSAIKKLDEVWQDKLAAEKPAEMAQPTIKDGFSKRNIILGFVFGVFVYALIVVLKAIFSDRIYSGPDVEKIISARHYGDVYKYPYSGFLNTLAHHKFVYNRRHKSLEATKIADDLATKLGFLDENQVALVALGAIDGEEDKIIEEQIKVLESNGIAVKRMNITGAISEVKDAEFVDLGPVFVQVISGKATFTTLVELRDKLNEYELKIVGTEFVEA